MRGYVKVWDLQSSGGPAASLSVRALSSMGPRPWLKSLISKVSFC